MAKRSPIHRLPQICIDENLSPSVADQFRKAGFRVLEVAKHPGLRGRDERDFIVDLLGLNAVFVTGDAEFVEEVLDQTTRHAGIVFVEQTSSPRDKEWFSLTAAYGIIGRCADGPRAFHGRIAYLAAEGIRVIHRGRDRLAYSWPALERLADTTVHRIRKPRRRRNVPHRLTRS